MTHPIVILGGGLAGLVTAHHLHRAGLAFTLLEARDRLGGRILSAGADGQPSADGFDLGPSWFWPGHQSELGNLVGELGLTAFAQHSEGDMLFQRGPGPALRYPTMRQEPPSMRIAGGTAALVNALAASLPAERIRLNTKVTGLTLQNGVLTVATTTGPLTAGHVVLALPPRLLAATIPLTPAPEDPILRRWQRTPTWMAPHAKFFALYDRPFWRDAGLSGAAQSQVGPLVEIHDSTSASGQGALFGFVGVQAPDRARHGRDAVIAASLRQLGQLFGPEALQPKATLLKDWTADPLTATAQDQTGGDHPQPTLGPWISGPWQGRLSFAGSETSQTEPGYLAGAVEAGTRIAHHLLAAPAV